MQGAIRALPVVAGLLLVLLFAAGCMHRAPEPATPWVDVPLTDLEGNGSFTIRELSARQPVLVAVLSESCPSCIILLERQVDQISRLPQVENGTVTVLALDLDPPPGPGFVRAHRSSFSFAGFSARAPENLTLDLLDDLGPFAIDTPQIPVILVCPGHDGILLPRGVKTTAELSAAVAGRC